jgi:hypothetical protein
MGSTMGKLLYFNAFHMNCVVHQSPGLWVHPDSRMDRCTDLQRQEERLEASTVRNSERLGESR